MRFLDWMSTPPGRVLRVFFGLALVALGLAVVHGIAGVAMAVFGLVPLATAIVNVCPIRPLVERLPLPCHPRGLQARGDDPAMASNGVHPLRVQLRPRGGTGR